MIATSAESSLTPRGGRLLVSSDWQPVLRELGLDVETVFSHPAIRVWRSLADRENCTLDAQLARGRSLRLHVKRYAAAAAPTPAAAEVAGHRLLMEEAIPTATLVAWGEANDGRSFVIFEDLAGFTPADKWLEQGGAFQRLLVPLADLAARLHQAGLHHRDLYLCHFMVKVTDTAVDVRLIDPARVRRLPRYFFRARWIVKDLAQFCYSATRHAISEAECNAWLERYSRQRHLPSRLPLEEQIAAKMRAIARHDQRLNQRQPNRNISLPW